MDDHATWVVIVACGLNKLGAEDEACTASEGVQKNTDGYTQYNATRCSSDGMAIVEQWMDGFCMNGGAESDGLTGAERHIREFL